MDMNIDIDVHKDTEMQPETEVLLIFQFSRIQHAPAFRHLILHISPFSNYCLIASDVIYTPDFN